MSREVAVVLYLYYGWKVMDIEARFEISEAKPEGREVVMRVPFGITRDGRRGTNNEFPYPTSTSLRKFKFSIVY